MPISKQIQTNRFSPPSSNPSSEGKIIFGHHKGQDRLYKRFGKKWKYVALTDGDWKVEKDLNASKNINLSGKLITKNYPAFSAYQSGSVDNQALADSTWTRITLDTENYDIGGDFASNYFTAPYNGIYHFDAKILLDGNYDDDAGDFDAGERLDCSLFKNAANATYGVTSLRMVSSLHPVVYAIDNKVWEARVSADLKLNAGDYIGMYGWHNSGVEQHTYSTAVDDWTRFTGHLVCAI